jgi:ubiquinone/menaquinone biosynthesis C-methylase UbiE
MTDRNTMATYNSIAREYDQHVLDPASSPLHAYYEKPAIHAEMPELDELTVLDLGCGSGADTEWAKENNAKKLFGVDISVELLEVAKTHHPDSNFSAMDISALAFKNDSFDLVYSSLAMHYISNWAKSLGEIRRVLKQEGMFIFSCNHPLETSMEYSGNEETRTAKIGRTIVQGTEERIIHGDYLALEDDRIKPIEGTVASGHKVHYYHRPFGKMIESIVASGFTIKKAVEPVPLPEMQEHNNEHYKQVMKQPKFLIWVLQK